MQGLQLHGVIRIQQWLLLPMFLLIYSISSANTSEDLQKRVYQFAKNTFKGSQATIKVNAIDQRLNLNPCAAKNLDIAWHTEAKAGRSLVKVECKAKQAWKIYVPLTIELYKQVHIANKDVSRGEVITRQDTTLTKVDIGKQFRGYIENISLYKERKLKRNVRKGEILHNGLFEIDYVINRGQEILLVSGNATIQVKIKATALDNGQTGDIIRVRNNSSSKIVQAKVRNKGLATVLY